MIIFTYASHPIENEIKLLKLLFDYSLKCIYKRICKIFGNIK